MKAKTLFEQKNFEEALKNYSRQIHISEHLDNNNYSKEEMEQINIINEKAKINFLRCFGKLLTFNSITE